MLSVDDDIRRIDQALELGSTMRGKPVYQKYVQAPVRLSRLDDKPPHLALGGQGCRGTAGHWGILVRFAGELPGSWLGIGHAIES
jgi:hypothetical protein